MSNILCVHRRKLLQTAAAVCASAPLGISTAADKQTQGGQGAGRLIEGWPKTSREAAQKMIEKYGQPHVAHATHLYWHKHGSWNYSIVYRDPIPHFFPMKHEDALEQAIDYRVPPDKFDELAAYDGSVIVRRTKGEASAMLIRKK